MKNGAPKNAVTTPIGSLGRCGQRATRDVDEDQEGGAERDRQRQQPPVAGAGDQPHRVRHEQADEADQSAHGDDRRRAERRRDHDDEPHARHGHAERRRLVVADAQHVEVAAVQEQHDATDR